MITQKILVTGLSFIITPYCFSLIAITFIRFKARLIYRLDKSANVPLLQLLIV